jgi:Nbl1 / Borealin N terminal
MASPRSNKRKSPEPDRDSQTADLARTPTASPVRKKSKITQSQKQALIDNLQLESALIPQPFDWSFSRALPILTHLVTERARKLRAHYALQVQDLRARIERRVNRIPVSSRKVRMGELLEKHSAASRVGEGTRTFKKPALPSKPTKNPATTITVDVGIQGSSSIMTAKSQSQHLKRRYESLELFVRLTADLLAVMKAYIQIKRTPRPVRMGKCLSLTQRNAATKMRREYSRGLFPR